MSTNVVVLSGRLTKDPEIRYSTGDKPICVATFFLAVEKYNKLGRSTDFIRCKAMGKQGEIVERFCTKGKQICITGEIHTGDYEKDGKKMYLTEVYAKGIELLGGKAEAKEEKEEQGEIPSGFTRFDEDIPF